MLQIVYISTAREAPPEAQLRAILAASRINNLRAGVTGLLVAGGRRFLQALEGPEEAVIATFERIRSDPRHFAIVELTRRPIERRAFGEWAMAYQQDGQVEDGSGLCESIERFIAPDADKSLRAQFTGFAEIHAPTA